MAAPPTGDTVLAERMKQLRISLGFSVEAAFAAYLGVSPQRWGNVEDGLPLGKDLAFRIVQRVPGVTLDWLWLGKTDGLSFEMVRKLGIGTAADQSERTRPL